MTVRAESKDDHYDNVCDAPFTTPFLVGAREFDGEAPPHSSQAATSGRETPTRKIAPALHGPGVDGRLQATIRANPGKRATARSTSCQASFAARSSVPANGKISSGFRPETRSR